MLKVRASQSDQLIEMGKKQITRPYHYRDAVPFPDTCNVYIYKYPFIKLFIYTSLSSNEYLMGY